MIQNPSEPAPPPEVGVSICVLASGSQGNCAVLVSRPEPGLPRRVVLLDAGLSPRRTGRLLLERGIRPDEVDDILFTHLDSDHCHSGWNRAIRPGGWRARLRIQQQHLGRAERSGLLFSHTVPFEDSIEIDPSLKVHVTTLAHDALGVAAFRIVAKSPFGEKHVGYATDLGRATQSLTRLLRGVDLLAIESNYCPVMQAESGRPQSLQQRITGGSGHLSNQEAAQAVRDIAPREHLVLLHLSRQCNTPEQALCEHQFGSTCPIIVSEQFSPTPWISVEGCAEEVRSSEAPWLPIQRPRRTRTPSLFESPNAGGTAW